MRSKDYTAASDSNIGDPLVDNLTSILNSTSHVDRCSSDRESQPVQPCSPNLGTPKSSTQQTGSVGMQAIGELFQKSGLLEDVVNVIMSSWRPSTHKQYTVYINKWLYFCDQQQIDPMHLAVTGVCKFLHSLFTNGLSYSVLNTARSVISNLAGFESNSQQRC